MPSECHCSPSLSGLRSTIIQVQLVQEMSLSTNLVNNELDFFPDLLDAETGGTHVPIVMSNIFSGSDVTTLEEICQVIKVFLRTFHLA